MKKGKSILTRCLALALALVLIVSSANLGAVLKVFAAEQTSVKVSDLVAKNYDLTEAEQKLITSGNLVDGNVSYAVFNAEEISVDVDTENKKISAPTYEGWVPVKAEIVVGSDVKETVTLTDGKGTYTFGENAFAVKVTYKLELEADKDIQAAQLNAAAVLVQGKANMDAAIECANLEHVVDALDILDFLVGGIDLGFYKVSFGDAAAAAVTALKSEAATNGGKLKLQAHNEAYNAADSKIGYLVNSGAAYKAAVVETYNNLKTLQADSLVTGDSADLVNQYLKNDDEVNGTGNLDKWLMFKGMLATAIAALEAPANDNWAFLNGTYLADGANYAQLDTLVAALGNISSNTVKNPLHFANDAVQVNLSMFNVNVEVILNQVEDKVDSAELVEADKKTGLVVLSKGASKATIEAEVKSILDEAAAAWAEYVCDISYSELPATLTEDITYTVTYTPKKVAVDLEYTDGADESVYYGYQMTLPLCDVAGQTYEYTVNGEKFYQGAVITITEPVTVSRLAGKAHTLTDLYTVVGDYFGNEVAQGILKSGALKDNESIYVRLIDQGTVDANYLMELDGTNLSAKAYEAWTPYAYGSASGKVNNIFAAAPYTGTVTEKTAYVQYKYDLSEFNADYSAATTEAIVEMAKLLKEEAEGQTAALGSLYANLGDMKDLNAMMISTLNGAIAGFDFTKGDDNYDDEYTVNMRARLQAVVKGINENALASHGDRNLKLYNLLAAAGDGASLQLKNYYQNSDAIWTELDVLIGYLDQMLSDDDKNAVAYPFTAEQKKQALADLCGAVGYGQYADMIGDLKVELEKGRDNLQKPNAMIDLQSANLGKLTDALVQKGAADKSQAYATPYLLSGELTVTNSAYVKVQANVYINGVDLGQTFATGTIDKDTAEMPAAEIDTLIKNVEEAVKNKLDDRYNYYTLSVSVSDPTFDSLTDLKGKTLSKNIYATYTYTVDTYTIKAEGMADQIVSADDLGFTLAQHDQAPAYVYKYYLGEELWEPKDYTLKLSDLDTMFTNGVCTFTRETLNEAEDNLMGKLEDLNGNTNGNTYVTEKDAEGNTVKLTANVAGSQNGVLGFAMDMILKGYNYIGLNGDPLIYTFKDADGNEIKEVSIQTLINAILADKTFGSESLIALGNNNGGKLLTATMQLGNSADELYYTDLEFVLNLNGVPGKMVTVANGLNAIKNNISFQSAGDYMNVDLHLPEKVYEVYLTAMWGIGELDKSDINAINNEIAFNFLYDYIMLIAESDVDAETFQNTLEVFDAAANEILDKDIPDYDLTQYDKYLQLVKKALTSEGIKVNADEKSTSITVEGQGKHILTLVDAIGLDVSSYETYIGYVKEFKEGNTLKASMKATLDNFDTNFEALILDANAAYDGAKEIKNIETKAEAIEEAKDLGKGLGLANAIDYVSDLPAESQTSGKSYVFLLDDIEDTVVFNNTTILDLNGKNINSIVANGHVYIMDSTLDTLSAGTVGSVSGNVTIIAGNYGHDVSAYLPDGYKQVGTNVQNALYTIESKNNGDLNFTVNTNVMSDESVNGYLPTIRGLAVDIASDIALNYYMTAMMSIDGNEIANIDFDDVVGIIKRTETATEAINEILCMFNAPGTSAFINSVSDDLLDFAAIESAINSGEKVASYDVTIAPYGIELYRNTAGNYLTFNVGSVDSKAWTFEVSLTLDGENKAKAAKVAAELDSIVEAEDTFAHIYLDQPTYSNRTLWLSGSGEASLSLDLSKEAKFQTIIAVILAYGNPDKADALVEAIGDENALKEIFNDISVEEVFTALKELEREVSFADMAKSLNVQVDYADAAAYEHYFHLLLSAVGYALERLDITGYTDKTMGMIEVDDSGRYTLSYSPDAHGDITRRGFTVDATAVVEEATLSVKIFNKVEEEPDCLWGDADHDDVVDQHDASLVMEYFMGLLTEEELADFCTLRTDVDQNGTIDQHDASLIMEHFMYGKELPDVEG